MPILNIAGYKFISLSDAIIPALKEHLLNITHSLDLKGTILLSHEGINISLAGLEQNVISFKDHLKSDHRFADITFHETYSDSIPFRTLKVKLKKEIITLKKPEANPLNSRIPGISPQELKQWLDEKRDITLLDTRNDYEVKFGTFTGAKNLHIKDFGEFPAAINTIDKDETVVMFCTGGIRCEKAGLYMQSQGYSKVYQLDGGILGYFAQVGGDHYQGECFVFDERVALDTDLQDTDTVQCSVCQGPAIKAQQNAAAPNVHCSQCVTTR